jgi:beta-ribofuranosylaminobenzene 5'-phosphate synthase
MSASVEIMAPSRLHFGLLSFGQNTTRQCGGAGVMIDQPGLRLRVSPAAQLEISGPLATRARTIVERYAEMLEAAALPACRIEILSAPEEHAGLGTGTQLALAVVQGVHVARGGQPLLPSVLAAWSGRGARSAIGTHGFFHGGLLVETGKYADQLLSPLERRVELPAEWRFVLIRPHGERGLSGDDERGAFDDLPPVPRATTAALLAELDGEMLPAAAAGEFERFSESVYRYGHAAGMCFAEKQGGPFASQRLAELVATIRERGIRGVGQSSWGPTLFAVLDSPAAAEKFTGELRSDLDSRDSILIAEPNRRGAQIIRHESP